MPFFLPPCPWMAAPAAPLARLRHLLAAALLAVLLPGLCASAAARAAATQFTVLTTDDQAATAEFIARLRETQGPQGRVDVVRLPTSGAAPPAIALAPPAAEEEGTAANAGVRTRGMHAAAAPAPAGAESDAVTVAIGPQAARQAIERAGREPLLLALLSRMDYEQLQANPALRRGDRRVGVLLRDPSAADQLALADAALPPKPQRRLGVVATSNSEPLVRDLERAAGKQWALQVATAPDANSIGDALRDVLPRSDALMVLPDGIGDDQAATLAVLRAAAGAGVPVIGASDGMVRSGALAAAVSSPAQLAQQARLLSDRLAAPGTGTLLVESAWPAAVRVNGTVARALGLRLPDERELTDRVAGPRR